MHSDRMVYVSSREQTCP